MTIYTFDKVTELLTELGLDSYFVGRREYYFKKLHPALHQEVYDTTAFLGTAIFIERLYCFTNGITDQSLVPTCKMCDKHVTYNRTETKFHAYCSSYCGNQDPDIQAKKDATYASNHGGSTKRIRTPEANAKAGAKTKEYLAKKREALVDSIINMEPTNLTRKEYKRLVLNMTEYMYTKYKDQLDPDSLRSKDYHIDHMVSILFGFMNHIPPHVIGDITNLRLLDAKSNISKLCDNHITFDELMERYNTFYEDNERPVLDTEFVAKHGITHNTVKRKEPQDTTTKYTEEAGVCAHCGGEAHYLKFDGTYLCQRYARECPARKAEIRISHRETQRNKKTTTGELAEDDGTMTPVTYRFFNNGSQIVRATECPDGYVDGKGLSWFNNGVITKGAFVCPEGFVPGKLMKTKQ